MRKDIMEEKEQQLKEDAEDSDFLEELENNFTDHYLKYSELNIKKKKYALEMQLELFPGAKEAYIRKLVTKAKDLNLAGERPTPPCLLKLQSLIRQHMQTGFQKAPLNPE